MANTHYTYTRRSEINMRAVVPPKPPHTILCIFKTEGPQTLADVNFCNELTKISCYREFGYRLKIS